MADKIELNGVEADAAAAAAALRKLGYEVQDPDIAKVFSTPFDSFRVEGSNRGHGSVRFTKVPHQFHELNAHMDVDYVRKVAAALVKACDWAEDN